MKHLRLLALLALAQPAIAGYTPPLEYGVAATITFDLYNTDGTLDVDEVDGGAEVTLYCDNAAGATATNDFVDEGPYYSLDLTAAELQCATLVVSVGATDTNNIHIWTIGSASAQVDDDGGWLDAVPYNSAWDAEIQSEAADALTAYDPPTRAELTSDISGLNDVSTAEVNAQVDAAIETYHLDHLLAADYDPASQPGVSTALLNELIESDSGVSRFTVNALEQGPSGSGASAASIADAVWDEARSGHTTAGTFGEYTPADVQYWNATEVTTALETSADMADAVWDEATAGHATAGTFGVLATDVLADTAVIGAAGAGLTAVPYNSAWDAEIQSEATDALNAYDPPTRAELTSDIGGLNDLSAAAVNAEVDTALADYDPPTRAELTSDIGGLNDLSAAAVNAEVDAAIETYHLDHLLAADYDPASQPGTSTALLNELIESDSGVSRFTVNALEQGPSGSGASAASIADAVWDEALSGHTTAGTAGDFLGVDVAAILADTAAIPSFPTNFADLDIEASTGHVDVGFWNGTAISTALEDSSDIADAVWDEVLSGHTTAGTAGDFLGVDVAAILADTAEIGTAGAGLTEAGGTGDQLTAVPYNSAWDAEIQSEATDALNAYDPPTRAELTSDIGGLNDLSAAAVNAEVDSAIETYHLDHLLAADYDPASQPGTSTALLNELIESDSGVSRFTINALEQGPSGSGASAAAIADAVWTETLADHSGGAGSTAEALDGAGGSGASASAIADAVLDEALSGHTTAGTLGAAIADIETDATAILADTNELQTDDVPSLIGTAQADLDILTGTDGATLATSQANYAPATAAAVAALNDLSAAEVNAEVDTALADYDAPTRAELTSDISGLNDLSAAEVNAEVDTALADYDPPTRAELTSDIAGLNDPTAAAIAAAVMASTCEDQGSGYTVQECLSILLAEAAGTAVYTTGSRQWVVSDPSGTETRLTIVYGSDLDGDRTSSTPAPMTP